MNDGAKTPTRIDAVKEMFFLLEYYRGTNSFDARVDAWMDKYAALAADDGKVGAIDRKFIIEAINPVNGKVYTEDSAVLLCAKDKAVPAALVAYRKECLAIGANVEHVASIELLIQRVVYFQSENECRVPDTVGAEIERCITGRMG